MELLAVSCEQKAVVGPSALNESRGAEGVIQPTVADSAAGVGVCDGDTQPNGADRGTAGCVWEWVSRKKHKVSMWRVCRAGLRTFEQRCAIPVAVSARFSKQHEIHRQRAVSEFLC